MDSQTEIQDGTVQVLTSPLLAKNILAVQDGYQIVMHEGGSGSGKTYSILLYIVFGICLQQTNQVITIVRSKLTDLKDSAMLDFENILKYYNLYNIKNHNKTSSTYTLNNNQVQFVGIDRSQQKRGARRDYLFINEANDISLEKWTQLSLRTRKVIFVDFNPSFIEHIWIDEAIGRKKDGKKVTIHIHSTYLDNWEFLSDNEKANIENLVNVDAYYDKVYRLGLRAVMRGAIFPDWNRVDEFPDNCKWIAYGLDFGYSNHPTALVKVGLFAGELYVEQLIYQTGLHNEDIHELMVKKGIKRNDVIIADSAEPKTIADLNKTREHQVANPNYQPNLTSISNQKTTTKRTKWNIKPAKKGKDSVNNGIMLMQKYTINVIDTSTDLCKEFQMYKWKEGIDGSLQNTPVDKFNHGMDAIRYVVQHKTSKGTGRRGYAFN